MSLRVARGLLVGAILTGGAAVVWSLLAPLVSLEAQGTRRASGGDTASPASALSDSLLAVAVARPMFRPGRRPAAVAFDPARSVSSAASDAPAVPKPPLSVSGIVWGGEPIALVEGLPGVEGSAVLRRGDSASGIRVVRIERDRVVLHGLDTTWNLPVREPWK
jgi:hypothetical protein